MNPDVVGWRPRGRLVVLVCLAAAVGICMLLLGARVSLPDTLGPVGVSAPERRELRIFSNGCGYSPRGVPKCGTIVGAAYGANTDPTDWEKRMGAVLGVRRTYFSPDQVAEAVGVAADDLANGRLPWISFKLPYSWGSMADGRGDTWVEGLAGRMAGLDGPVWLAFHHEPEGDGDIRDWTAMQKRLAPLVRDAAPNVAYTVILTGYNQLYGSKKYSLDSLWPKGVKVDIVGFDVYEKYGVVKNGSRFTTHTRFNTYFTQFQAFAEKHGIAWGLGETGQSDVASRLDPTWLARTVQLMARHHGVVLTYFNSSLNSIAPWGLSGQKQQGFTDALKNSPRL